MSLMGNLYVGNSGLQTSQNALNTVTHNLANVDTAGYTRQQVLQADRNYNKIGASYASAMQTGLGVNYAQVRQVRDYFLDKTYRLENGRAAYYQQSYDVAVEVDTLFGEMEGVEFQTALADLWTSAEELQKTPSDSTAQGLFINRSAIFLDRAQAVYNGLSAFQDILNDQVKDTVDVINDYGDKIHALNKKIVAIESGGFEKANDYRDERNMLIDELSGYGKVSTYETAEGAILVQFEDKDFVTRTYVNKMEAVLDNSNSFYNVVWERDINLLGDKMEVYDFTREINSAINTDVGKLKALVLLRGDDRGTYTDIPDSYVDFASMEKPQPPDPAEVTDPAQYDAQFEAYRRDMVEYMEQDHYYNMVDKSLLQKTMAEFDKLIHGIVTQINEVLNPVSEDGTYQQGINLFLRQGTFDENITTRLPGEEVNGEIPNKQVVDEYDGSDMDSDGSFTMKDVRLWKASVKSTWYNTSNLKINPYLFQQYNQLGALAKDSSGTEYTEGFMTADSRENREMSDRLMGLFGSDFSTLNPKTATMSNYMEYYSNLIGETAAIGYGYNVTSQTQNMTIESIENSRQQVLGVSDNEELNNMIMYQNAYNASSRYINAVNELLSHLINTLGT